MTKDINLFDLGCLVQVSVGMWSARKMLTKADLQKVGVDPRGVPDDICNLGRKLLVPKEEIAKFTSHRAAGPLVPGQVVVPVRHRLGVLRARPPRCPMSRSAWRLSNHSTLQAVDSFIGRFEQMKEVIQARHPEFWSRCLRPHYPRDAASLRERFYFKYFVFKVAGLGETQEMIGRGGDGHARGRSGTDPLLKEQMAHEVGEFVEQAVGTLRQETVRFCDLVMARVNGTPLEGEDEPKKLTGRSLVCFKKYVEWFQQMNLFGDDQIETMLAGVSANVSRSVLQPDQSPDASRCSSRSRSGWRRSASWQRPRTAK